MHLSEQIKTKTRKNRGKINMILTVEKFQVRMMKRNMVNQQNPIVH